ncbi:hypothetical protein TIFTF001_056457 [Ficus carica]|uniref:Uncharacterized protein n=1 Tax=Ficus carica TaxID=3494 RepID=A0AA88JI41_FICCA|nr:hypothetical protein TIFTF001_056457 [Ficus carica]
MLKRSPRARTFGRPGQVELRVLPVGRHVSAPHQSERAVGISDETGAVIGGVSGGGSWALCQDTAVVGEVLSGPRAKAPAGLRLGYTTDSASLVDTWSLCRVSGKESRPSRI